MTPSRAPSRMNGLFAPFAPNWIVRTTALPQVMTLAELVSVIAAAGAVTTNKLLVAGVRVVPTATVVAVATSAYVPAALIEHPAKAATPATAVLALPPVPGRNRPAGAPAPSER